MLRELLPYTYVCMSLGCPQEADDKLVKRVKRYMTKEMAGDMGGWLLDLCVVH
jgi:hypothetical protein